MFPDEDEYESKSEANRFWYEDLSKYPYDDLYWKVREQKVRVKLIEYRHRPLPTNPGTKPDVGIRW